MYLDVLVAELREADQERFPELEGVSGLYDLR